MNEEIPAASIIDYKVLEALSYLDQYYNLMAKSEVFGAGLSEFVTQLRPLLPGKLGSSLSFVFFVCEIRITNEIFVRLRCHRISTY